MLNINTGITKLSRDHILNTVYHSGVPYFLDHAPFSRKISYQKKIHFHLMVQNVCQY